MPTNILYEERRKSTAIVVILASITLFLVFAALATFRFGPSEEISAVWAVGICAILIGILTFWFRRIDIRLTDEGVRVSYGPFSRSLSWKDIAASEETRLPWYWGYGIRFARHKGRWIFAFNVIGGPGVAFLTKNNRPWGLYVSTLHPEQIVSIAQTKCQNSSLSN